MRKIAHAGAARDPGPTRWRGCHCPGAALMDKTPAPAARRLDLRPGRAIPPPACPTRPPAPRSGRLHPRLRREGCPGSGAVDPRGRARRRAALDPSLLQILTARRDPRGRHAASLRTGRARSRARGARRAGAGPGLLRRLRAVIAIHPRRAEPRLLRAVRRMPWVREAARNPAPAQTPPAGPTQGALPPDHLAEPRAPRGAQDQVAASVRGALGRSRMIEGCAIDGGETKDIRRTEKNSAKSPQMMSALSLHMCSPPRRRPRTSVARTVSGRGTGRTSDPRPHSTRGRTAAGSPRAPVAAVPCAWRRREGWGHPGLRGPGDRVAPAGAQTLVRAARQARRALRSWYSPPRLRAGHGDRRPMRRRHRRVCGAAGPRRPTGSRAWSPGCGAPAREGRAGTTRPSH